MTDRALSPAQLCDAARALYAARRNYIEHAETAKEWANKRPPEWFAEQRSCLAEIAQIGSELRFIADNAAAYDAWKSGLVK
jgi:hypothetical protein